MKRGHDLTKIGYIGHLVDDTLDFLRKRFESENYLIGIKTGFKYLDMLTCGLQKGDLIIVGSQPGMGKSTFIRNIAEFTSEKENGVVLIFSAESSATDITVNMMSSLENIDSYRLRSGNLKDEDWPKIRNVKADLSSRKIFINDSCELTPEYIDECVSYVHGFGPISLIVIDNLQAIKVEDTDIERAEELSRVTHSLKVIAKKFDTPMIVASQLNKAASQRYDKRPILSDLLGASSIEHDADLIMFVYRDEVYNPSSPAKGTAEIIVAKQRKGPLGTVRLNFLGHYSRFENFVSSSNIPAGAYHPEFSG